MLCPYLCAIAQFETEIRAERQMDGIRNAKANGVQLGRRKHLTEDEQIELQQQR
ncbi:recombinase family protein [cf. Phormidesmis sp. LEGE 11477]|uniref:recombinase family protein n=1 Tax=cf. Phormidesmis sp. LEGE 11477 TaxID=1828680 RepID=UPI001D1419F9|nr:recombinase family protein [cf. Phormidesmis sp. LEGE 11477]